MRRCSLLPLLPLSLLLPLLLPALLLLPPGR